MKKIIFLVFLIVLITGGLIAYKTYEDTINYVAEVNEPIELNVVEGENFTTLLDTLETQGLVKNKDIIKIYLRLNNLNPSIKAGEYVIRSNIGLTELISVLEKGVLKPGINVTIKEGLVVESIADVIALELGEGALFNKQEFLNFISNPDFSLLSEETSVFFSKYLPVGKPLEGFLFPDTYEFLPEQTTINILDIILGNFAIKINDAINLESLNLNQNQITTLYEAVTLASIIEKEASNRDRKEVISSVFHNRLNAGMRLQSDATVNYVTKKNDAAALIEDTLIESPFNTYRSDGIPPTPINSPGIQSIVAAFYPDSTNFYYFFHDDNGEAYLSSSYNEHLIKVEQIRGFN